RIVNPDANIEDNAAAAAEDYISARYLSATEATWRIFAKDLCSKTPSVLRLNVHGPQENRPQFRQTQRIASNASTLIRYLLRPLSYAALTYIEYFERIVFRTPTASERANPALLPPGSFLERSEPGSRFLPNVVSNRRSGSVVARMKWVRPSHGDAFYIRVILRHRPASSWLDLRTTQDGQVHPTFQQAALHDGLIEADDEANLTMTEAINLHTSPSDLRFLFVLLINEGANAAQLWTLHSEALSRDFLPLNEEFDDAPLRTVLLAERSGLTAVDELLRTFGLSTAAVGLPSIDHPDDAVEEELNFFRPRRQRLLAQSSEARSHFTAQQHNIRSTIINTVMQAHNEMMPRLHLIQGRAGRGKTFVVKAIIDELRGHGHVLAVCGATGLSASAFTRATTVHKRFSIPVVDDDNDQALLRSTMKPNAPAAAFLKNVSAIFIDELWALSLPVISAVDTLMRELTNRDLPFGGKVVIGIGDPRQTAPITKDNSRQSTLESSFLSSPLFPLFQIHELAIPQRQTNDPNFGVWVDTIGDDFNNNSVDLSPMFQAVPSLDEARTFLFPPTILANPAEAVTRCFLTPLNKRVDEFNSFVTDALPSQLREMAAHDSVRDGEEMDEDDIDTALLAVTSTTHPGIPDHTLKLKVGQLCSILRNLDVSNGLVKHARITITALNQRTIQVRILSTMRTFLLPRITFVFSPARSPLTIIRKQFPLRPAYASTFHGCQGLTLTRTVIDCTVPVFTHGQRYAAVSRTRSRHDVRIYTPEGTSPVVNNIVYRELIEI
ncbi:hypothetical protein CF335_g7568, partial [Tilletia laevis]